LLVLAFGSILGATEAKAADKFLRKSVEFTGSFVFLETKAPGVVIGVIRNGETVVRGYGDHGRKKRQGPRTATRACDHQGLGRRRARIDDGRPLQAAWEVAASVSIA
jgi:hypothetical protein